MDLSLQGILGRLLLYIPVLLLSLTVHEFAHAWSARRLGDDTAERLGRLTLNPLAHADPIGTFILPLLNVPFGWAKPVPVNPARFRRDVHMGTGMAITAAAGPASNLVLALACGLGLGLVLRMDPGGLTAGLAQLLNRAIILNISLALFNLLPIPPLDGSRIVDGFMPIRLRPQWEAVSRVAPFVLLALVFLGRGFLLRILAGPRDLIIDLLLQLVLALRG